MQRQAWMSPQRFGIISACTTTASPPGASKRRTLRRGPGPKSSPRSAIIAEAAARAKSPSGPQQLQHVGGGSEVAPAVLAPLFSLLILAPLADLPILIDMCRFPGLLRREALERDSKGKQCRA